MKYKHFLAIALGLISAINVYSQWIEHDKTQKNGRIIITSASEVYEESGKEGKIALYYRQIADGKSARV